ncbi:MAG: hypothetical protein K2N01_12075 [Lachnospiraceae bacterium]|nr:hypothetical protein [Lachnospiraceae bacterium]
MMIQMKHAVFAGKVKTWSQTANKIETDRNVLPEGTDGMYAMKMYLEGADSIWNALKAYHILVTRDAERFQSVQKLLMEADENMI